MKLSLVVLLILGCWSCVGRCARILAVLPLAARSHHAFFQPILKALAVRGHNVTVYSPFSQPHPVPNYKDVYVSSSLVDVNKMDMAFWNFLEGSQIATDRSIWKTTYRTTEELFEQECIKKLLQSDEQFDLVFTQATVGHESMLVFGHKFKAANIALQPKAACVVDNRVMGNSLSLSYIPDVGLPYSTSMTFTERLINAYSKLSVLYYHYWDQIPKQEAVLKRYFNDPALPPLSDMIQNISLMFTLGHPTALYSQPSVPNIIPLGGIHINKDRKPLSEEIKTFLDGTDQGFIYFSLGTYVPDHMMGEEYFQNYINVFKTLPQKVIWKTRAELKGLPPNIFAGKWMPQQDILAHPNCVLFVTHGGLLSQHEAIYYGVPVITIPYFADQPMNARVYEHLGVGISLDYKNLSQVSIHKAVTTVLGDDRFRINMKQLSRIFRDQPQSPTESVVFWTEYVLRHGAAHLKPASTQLNLYQLALLDVAAVVLFIVFICIIVSYLAIKRLCKLLYILYKSKPYLQIKVKNS